MEDVDPLPRRLDSNCGWEWLFISPDEQSGGGFEAFSFSIYQLPFFIGHCRSRATLRQWQMTIIKWQMENETRSHRRIFASALRSGARLTAS